MKKALVFFTAMLSLCPELGHAVATIKKAAPVASQQKSAMDSTGSLVPTVLGLVSSVQSLSAKTKELTAECVPSSADITFVNNVVKEWAKTGAATADEAEKSLGMRRCPNMPSGGYAHYMELYAGDAEQEICTDWFGDESEKDMVWYGFPKAAVATVCSDGSYDCGNSKKKTVSNIYNVFNLVDFGIDDYTKREAQTAASLLNKIEKCSDAKLSARKREMWGDFLINTLGNVGQSTNTGAIMQSVQSVSGSGLGGLSSISGLATDLLNK